MKWESDRVSGKGKFVEKFQKKWSEIFFNISLECLLQWIPVQLRVSILDIDAVSRPLQAEIQTAINSIFSEGGRF